MIPYVHVAFSPRCPPIFPAIACYWYAGGAGVILSGLLPANVRENRVPEALQGIGDFLHRSKVDSFSLAKPEERL